MTHLTKLLTAIGVGAGLAYLYDPVAGRRRRALLRDKLIHGINKTGDVADARYRDLKNRAYGTYHELQKDARQVAEAATNVVGRPTKDTKTFQETGGWNK
jgi:phytoene/squalene synthetase